MRIINLITGLALVLAALGLAAGPALAGGAVCTTDLDCAAYELQTALDAGATVHEDLSFAGASELYGAKNDLLADAFWAAHDGEDWTDVEQHLPAWLDAYRSA